MNPKLARVSGLAAICPLAEERADVIAFLKSLTDDELPATPAFSDPWKTP